MCEAFVSKSVEYDSIEYHQTLTLRERVLRIPIGKVISDADIGDDSQQFHFALFNHLHCVACLAVKPLANITVKLRQMAVADSFQRQGLGTLLIKETEKWLLQNNYQFIELSAR